MGSRTLWRRTAAAAGLYSSVALGLAGTVVATNTLGLHPFGIYATALTAASFLQSFLDLTVEEALTKFGFRYVAAADWSRLRRVFGIAVKLKLAGGLVATLLLLALAPLGHALFGPGIGWPLVAVAALPLVQSLENVAGTALLLRGRYDIRGWLAAGAMGLRFAAIAVGVQFGVWQALALITIAQAIATATTCVAGRAAFRRFPKVAPRPLAEDGRDVRTFVVQSSLATGLLSMRTTLAPLLLGLVTTTTELGLYRIAQAPQSGLTAASSPVRLVLLTEQTRDWEHGKEQGVLRGVRLYSLAALGLMTVAVPAFFFAMPWLVPTVFGDDKSGAVHAAQVVLGSAAVQVVFGWTKSLPVTIGKPRLRILTHGIETAVLLPLTVAFALAWGVTGAAFASLVASLVFALVWLGALGRIRAEVARRAGSLREAAVP